MTDSLLFRLSQAEPTDAIAAELRRVHDNTGLPMTVASVAASIIGTQATFLAEAEKRLRAIRSKCQANSGVTPPYSYSEAVRAIEEIRAIIEAPYTE